MKFTCSAKTLNEACNNVMRAVSTKVTIPTIEGILVECGSDTLSLTGYDFEFGINTILQATVFEPGAIVINAKIFCDIIRKVSSETVIVETNGTSISIAAGAAQYNIKGISADEYPKLPSVFGGIPLFINKGILQQMVNQTIFAVAENENSKPVHTGLKFEMSLNQLRLIGVDGYRLAIRTETIKYDGENVSFIVPKKTIRELIKIIGNETENDVQINVGKRHIIFEVDNYSIISRLLEGDFLDYEAALPKSSSTTVLINTNDAVKCIERTIPVIENNAKNPIRCLFDNDEMRISTVSSLGRVVDYTHANISGNRVEIGFNSKYLLDALNAADTDQVKIELGGPVNPVKVLPINDESFLFLVLPMRLKNTDNN
ncbi:MAG: DNA polymerase III subunit beta [Clostridiales bacterium]|nr:DNA polymerase III subunit beta [Clostridiales bacterium]